MNNHFQMEDDKKCEMARFFLIPFQTFFGQLIQTKN
jgi:hypothetical protein